MATPQLLPVPRLLWGPITRADYYRMAELGVLRDGVRTELLDGLVVAVSPSGRRHAGCVNRLNHLLAHAAAECRVMVSVQLPVVLDDRSEPEPDVAVLAYRRDGYAEGHPGPEDALLLIEASDTTVSKARGIKRQLYALAGIREYWIVDFEAGVIDMYRDPGPDGYTILG